jgi:DNA topoisomerase-1
VVKLLEEHFPELVDYDFTARMEDDLDRIAAGRAEMVPWLSEFYFGPPDGSTDDWEGLHRMVSDLGDIDARQVNSVPIGEGLVVRVGRYGPYLEQGDQRANVPPDLPPDELTPELARELLARPSGDRELGTDPSTGLAVVARDGRYGPYVTEVPVDGAADPAGKPRTASLFKTMSMDTVTLDDALRLLTLPRVLGVDPADGVEVTAQNGRYGPYVKKGTESRSLEAEEQLFTADLGQALALLAQPKARGRRAATASEPLRTLGTDPATGRTMVVRDGRFGPYVTDGETNASLRAGDDVAELSDARGAELLADRRERGPAPKRAAKNAVKKPAKKAAKKPAKKPAERAAEKAPAGR